MIHASLFSGIGGPEVAAKMMGWENAFHCEINPFGRAVLDYWFPESKSYEDITKTSFKEWRGRIDVLTGGFPCQPFSYAGKRGGREDERYLWPEMLRVIDEVRPTWVVGENVAGITTMVEGGVCTDLGGEATLFAEGDELHRYELDQSYTIERICKDLEHLGYSVQSVLVPAAAVGAPHRRDRVFIIAHDDVNHPDLGADDRPSGENEGAEGEERLPERDNLHLVGDASEVRSKGAGTDTDSLCDGREELGEFGVHGGGDLSARDYAERETMGTTPDSTGELRDGDGHLHGLQPRTRPLSESGDGHREDDVTHPAAFGCEGRDNCASGREATDGSVGQPCRPGEPTETESGDCGGCHPHHPAEKYLAHAFGIRRGHPREYDDGEPTQSRKGERGELHPRGADSAFDRWGEFPTVSPIHRGNDGIPFPLDCLAIPESKWRTESLKAYGNAIVPQVMYRIFQAIEFAEANSKTDINF